MGGGTVFIEILIFAMIAAFLVYRLRSVLGRRHGEERQRPNPYTPQPNRQNGTMPDNVVHLPDRARVPAEEAARDDEPQSLAASIDRIRSADPSFEEKGFVQGATAAFRMIVEAFAAGDTATLRPLLSDDVYDNFAAAIRERQKAGEALETNIHAVKDADVIEARLDGRTAFVTVKFVSDQMNVTRNREGEVIAGDADAVEEVIDIWTFGRNTRSRDPNWLLVETRTPN